MIRQQVGDLLEIRYEGRYFYLVVLTKVAMLGGNIVFAHHTDGNRRTLAELDKSRCGFNVCTDLWLAKTAGDAIRLKRYDDTSDFWLTNFAKAPNDPRHDRSPSKWFIFDICSLAADPIAQVSEMSQEYREAMDYETVSFDLTAEKILRGYKPDLNPLLS